MSKNVACLILTLILNYTAFGSGMPPAENKVRDMYLPTPFSAEQIRDFCKPGYTTRHLFENQGQKSVIQTVTFLESEDPTIARFSSKQESTTGELISDDGITEIEWTKLQAHASFREDITKVSEEDYELDGVTYSCWRFDVMNIVPFDEGKKVVPVEMTFWFAKDLPGPPIKMVQTVKGEPGPSMTMIIDKACCQCCCCKEAVSNDEAEKTEESEVDVQPSPGQG